MEPIPTMDNRLTVAFFIRDNEIPSDFKQTALDIISEINKRITAINTQISESILEQSSKITSDNIFTEGFNKTVQLNENKE